MPPKVSVVVATKNNALMLDRLLSSLKTQTFKDFETIVIDDGSNDSTFGIAKSYKTRIIRNKRSLGPAVSRNKGFKATKSPIIAVTDDDCIPDKDWVKRIYEALKGRKVKVLMGKTAIPRSNFLGNCIAMLGFPAGGNLGFEKMWKVDEKSFTDHISTCNLGIRKEVFTKHGYFDEIFPLAGGEDAEFSSRLKKSNVKVKYIPEILVQHEPRRSLISFIKWQILRGRSNYHFQKRVGHVSGFIKLRIWSSLNIIKANVFSLRIFLVLPLLILSFILQQLGYILERLK